VIIAAYVAPGTTRRGVGRTLIRVLDLLRLDAGVRGAPEAHSARGRGPSLVGVSRRGGARAPACVGDGRRRTRAHGCSVIAKGWPHEPAPDVSVPAGTSTRRRAQSSAVARGAGPDSPPAVGDRVAAHTGVARADEQLPCTPKTCPQERGTGWLTGRRTPAESLCLVREALRGRNGGLGRSPPCGLRRRASRKCGRGAC
jgi:hypothetical protein